MMKYSQRALTRSEEVNETFIVTETTCPMQENVLLVGEVAATGGANLYLYCGAMTCGDARSNFDSKQGSNCSNGLDSPGPCVVSSDLSVVSDERVTARDIVNHNASIQCKQHY